MYIYDLILWNNLLFIQYMFHYMILNNFELLNIYNHLLDNSHLIILHKLHLLLWIFIFIILLIRFAFHIFIINIKTFFACCAYAINFIFKTTILLDSTRTFIFRKVISLKAFFTFIIFRWFFFTIFNWYTFPIFIKIIVIIADITS